MSGYMWPACEWNLYPPPSSGAVRQVGGVSWSETDAMEAATREANRLRVAAGTQAVVSVRLATGQSDGGLPVAEGVVALSGSLRMIDWDCEPEIVSFIQDTTA